MIQLPNHMPAHCSDEDPGNMAWLHLEVGLDGHKIVSNSTGDGSLHDGREKLEEWAMLVGQPQQ